MRELGEKVEWGQVDKIGKGTKAHYDSEKKVLTFCFKRGPETTGELLRASRELLMKELKDLGYSSRMKYNGEVVVDNVQENDVILVKKNHKLTIRLNRKQAQESVGSSSSSVESKDENLNRIKFV